VGEAFLKGWWVGIDIKILGLHPSPFLKVLFLPTQPTLMGFAFKILLMGGGWEVRPHII